MSTLVIFSEDMMLNLVQVDSLTHIFTFFVQ